jgi:hypothetical protein
MNQLRDKKTEESEERGAGGEDGSGEGQIVVPGMLLREMEQIIKRMAQAADLIDGLLA